MDEETPREFKALTAAEAAAYQGWRRRVARKHPVAYGYLTTALSAFVRKTN